ncbi:hypothetical protein ACFQQB_61545 [Nonomuraea rubra]|uniref:family 4 glycosyl hydrolase n=1 Tax=Nonomuraea rubra TaxID=46180 RepID=UPI003619E1A5
MADAPRLRARPAAHPGGGVPAGQRGQPGRVQAHPRPRPAGRRARPRRHRRVRPQIIHSIVTGTPRVVYGNVVNDGLISNLPQGCVVEVPCVVDATGVRPTAIGALPPQCAALNRTYASVNELTVRAALEGDPRHVRHALMIDPNTAASLTLDDIWRMADDLTRAHGDLLPEALRA